MGNAIVGVTLNLDLPAEVVRSIVEKRSDVPAEQAIEEAVREDTARYLEYVDRDADVEAVV